MKLKELEVRASDLRVEINQLATADDADLDKLRELRSEYEGVETRIAALKAIEGAAPAEGDAKIETRDDAEGRELRALVGRANMGRIFDAALSHRSLDGPEHELQKHYGLESNQIPLAMLEDELEVRTAGVTPAPAEVGQTQRPIIPAVFPQAAASFLGISQDRVPVGEAVYTVLSTSAAPGTPDEGDEQDHSTGAFSAKVLAPARIQASLFYSREDRARFVGMASALRRNLSDALADKLDDQVLTGSRGLFHGTNLAANAANAADTFASYRKRFVYDAIDGTYASQESDLRILVGADTLADMAIEYRANSADDSALDSIRRITSGVRVSAHVPEVAEKKQNAIVRRGMRQDFACGIWEGISLITDEVTQAKAGEIVITAVMLYACQVLRKDGFRKVQAQHS